MAVIDLETGELTDEQPVSPLASTPAVQDVQAAGGIIDLNTGEMIQEQAQPIAPPIAQAQPEDDRNFAETILGGASAATTLAFGTAGAAAGGLTALVDLINPFTDNNPTKTIENIASMFNVPLTEGGEAAFNKIASIIEPIKPVIDSLTEFRDRGAAQGLEVGGPALATAIRMLPDIAIEASGIGRATPELPLRTTEAGRSALRAEQQGEFKLEPVTAAQSEITTARAGQEAASETGVDLFKAQQTLNPTDLERQSFVAQLPAGAVKARESLAAQNTQVLDAVDSVLNNLATPESVGSAAGRFRTASQKAIDAIKNIRKEGSSPIYKQAFRRQRQGKTELINTTELQTKVDAMAAQFDPAGEIAKNLNSASKKIKQAKGDLQKLHLAKIEIDQTINSFAEGSVGNTTKRFLTDVVTDLTDELTSQSPSYKAAKDEFQRLSGPVNKIQDSPIGKIANFDDVQLKAVAQKIFDPSETNPQVVLDAKKAIQGADSEAWNVILRAEIERRMGRIRADIDSPDNISSVENIPSQLFNSIFGNKKSRDVLFSALDGEAKANMRYLETILKRASSGRPGGSQTGVRSEISRELRGGAFQSIRDFIKSPTGQVASIGEEASFNSRVKALSNAMFDPTWRAEMKQLRSLSPSSSTAKKIFDNILNSALIAAPTAPGIINNDRTQEQN